MEYQKDLGMAGVGRFGEIASRLRAMGLAACGGFRPGPEDGVPEVAPGRKAAVLVMVGHRGPDFWPAFEAARPAGDDPLDSWSRAVLEPLAAQWGARALYPFGGPPFHPFQRWAMKADALWPSPIGPLIHPRFGLWHAFRGALIFDTPFDLPPRAEAFDPCAACRDRPCLSACPVGAAAPFDAEACTHHLQAPEGKECRLCGCRARRACPVGRDMAYGPAQAAFHMAAFLRGRGG